MGDRSADRLAAMRARLAEIGSALVERAVSLPGGFYTDREWFEAEMTEVLAPAWHGIGRIDQVAEPGDYFTAELLGEPLLVTCGPDGERRVLANVCRHRGSQVASGAGSSGHHVCPYHAWSYRSDGLLAAAPGVENEAFDPATCSLFEWPSVEWNGSIFVTFGGEASAPFPGAVGDLDGLAGALAPYQGPAMRTVHVEEEVWACNWKCLVENFMEGYHLSVLHTETLHPITPTRLVEKGPVGEAFTSYWSPYPDDLPLRGPAFDTVTAYERKRSLLWDVYPASMASQTATFHAGFALDPTAVDEVRVRWTLSVHPDFDGDLLDRAIQLWRDTNTEDRALMEQLQRTLSSRAAGDAAGPIASDRTEGTIHDFHRWLAGRMGASPGG